MGHCTYMMYKKSKCLFNDFVKLDWVSTLCILTNYVTHFIQESLEELQYNELLCYYTKGTYLYND